MDPLTPQNRCLPGWSVFMDGDLEAGRARLEWISLEPAIPILAWVYASMLARLGRRDEALAAISRIRAIAPDSLYDGFTRFFEAVFEDDGESAMAAIAPFIEKAWWNWQYSWEVASGYALLGETDEAIRWLRNAVDRGFLNYPFLNEHAPFLENLRDDQRFEELMAYTRKRWESFDI
jgi:tetratricopeptide (TPR) repeat protein